MPSNPFTCAETRKLRCPGGCRASAPSRRTAWPRWPAPVDRYVQPSGDAPQACSNRGWRVARDPIGQETGLGQECRVLDHSIDQADVHRLLRVDRLGREDHLQRALSADQPRKPLGATERRREPQSDLRFCEAGPIACQRQRRRLRDLAAGPEGDAVDGGDERLRITLDVPGQPLAAAHEVSQRAFHAGLDAAGKLGDVGAGAEGAISRASEDHGADAGIRFQLIESRFERIDERVVERIELVGSMERENSDAVLHLSQEGRHAGELPAVRGRGHPHARSSGLHGCRTGNGGHFKNAGLARVFREGAALLAARAST